MLDLILFVSVPIGEQNFYVHGFLLHVNTPFKNLNEVLTIFLILVSK